MWGKIRGAVSAIAPSAALRLPELSTPPPIAPVAPMQPVAPPSADVITLSSRARRWRGIAQGVTALAACLVALIGVQAYRPDLLPEADAAEGCRLSHHHGRWSRCCRAMAVRRPLS